MRRRHVTAPQDARRGRRGGGCGARMGSPLVAKAQRAMLDKERTSDGRATITPLRCAPGSINREAIGRCEMAGDGAAQGQVQDAARGDLIGVCVGPGEPSDKRAS